MSDVEKSGRPLCGSAKCSGVNTSRLRPCLQPPARPRLKRRRYPGVARGNPDTLRRLPAQSSQPVVRSLCAPVGRCWPACCKNTPRALLIVFPTSLTPQAARPRSGTAAKRNRQPGQQQSQKQRGETRKETLPLKPRVPLPGFPPTPPSCHPSGPTRQAGIAGARRPDGTGRRPVQEEQPASTGRDRTILALPG
jgi:hypothetical protein